MGKLDSIKFIKKTISSRRFEQAGELNASLF